MKQEDPVYRLKQGCGSHTMFINGKKTRITPGQLVECPTYRLGNALDKFDLVRAGNEARMVPDKMKIEPVLFAGEDEPRGYDVINQTTKRAVNTQVLTKREAYELAGQEWPDDDGETPDDGYGEGDRQAG